MDKFKVGDKVIRCGGPAYGWKKGTKAEIKTKSYLHDGKATYFVRLLGKDFTSQWYEKYMDFDPDHIVSPEATYFRYRKRSMLEMIE